MRPTLRTPFFAALQTVVFGGALFTGLSAGAAGPAVRSAPGPAPSAAGAPPACIPNRTGRPLPSPPFCQIPPPRPLPDRRPATAAIRPPAPGAVSAVRATSLPCYQPIDGESIRDSARICPPPPPPNELVDTNSAQTIYGGKVFLQPISGDLDGTAAYAYEFSGELSGDVVGTQYETRIVNVNASALPSIGFGLSAGPRIKYVMADADPNDNRMDGSITHPFSNLGDAARSARSGDRFILHGTLNGHAAFAAAVTLEGAGPDQTVLYGSVEFTGYGSSMLRNLRVNCTSPQACVTNRAVAGGALRIDNVIVSQSDSGPAVATLAGPLQITRGAFTSTGAGNALALTPYSTLESRLSDSVVGNPNGGVALFATTGALRIEDSAITSGGGDPALVLIDLPRFSARGMTASGGGTVMQLRNSRSVTVFDSAFAPGSQQPAVTIDNDVILTFAIDRNPGLVFANNTFASDTAEIFRCSNDSVVMTNGNLIPLYAVPSGIELKNVPPVMSCQQISYAGF